MPSVPEQLAPGLHRWTARHPDWHPGEFGREVASFAFDLGGGQALAVDPILPDPPDAVWHLLDGLATERLSIAVTIPYHVRDSEAVWRRCAERGVQARVLGHERTRRRLGRGVPFEELVPGQNAGGLTPYAIGRPVRVERPLHVPAHDALLFGDALVVTPEGDLRIWDQERPSPERARFVAERFAPTFAPLLDLAPERILVTHGAPVLRRGRAALEEALTAGPWPGG